MARCVAVGEGAVGLVTRHATFGHGVDAYRSADTAEGAT
jgi:hypothetical protein